MTQPGVRPIYLGLEVAGHIQTPVLTIYATDDNQCQSINAA